MRVSSERTGVSPLMNNNRGDIAAILKYLKAISIDDHNLPWKTDYKEADFNDVRK